MMPNDWDVQSIAHEYRARTDIHEALMRACRGVDRLDRELILSAYHPGARDNHGSFDGPIEAFVDWVFSNHAGKVDSCVHHLGNIMIQVHGKTAHCESYVLAFHRRTLDGVLVDLMSHGRYIDRFEERNGEWKIADRFVLFDWDRVDPVERQWSGPLTMQLEKGRRSRQDGSYRAFPPLGTH
jgi:hypothetical protein